MTSRRTFIEVCGAAIAATLADPTWAWTPPLSRFPLAEDGGYIANYPWGNVARVLWRFDRSRGTDRLVSLLVNDVEWVHDKAAVIALMRWSKHRDWNDWLESVNEDGTQVQASATIHVLRVIGDVSGSGIRSVEWSW